MSSNNEGSAVQPQPFYRRIWLRFTLKTLLVAILVTALLVVWLQERGKRLEMARLAGAQLKVCDNVAELTKALGGGTVRVVNFDDVDTSKTDYTAFAADRYADRGITITGQGGQYAGRVFSNPSRSGGLAQYAPNSPPNSYAPGPTAPRDAASATAGGNKTVITFTVDGRPALVPAFGAVFIDADWPVEGPALLTVFGWDGRQIGKTQEISGGPVNTLTGQIKFKRVGAARSGRLGRDVTGRQRCPAENRGRGSRPHSTELDAFPDRMWEQPVAGLPSGHGRFAIRASAIDHGLGAAGVQTIGEIEVGEDDRARPELA